MNHLILGFARDVHAASMSYSVLGFGCSVLRFSCTEMMSTSRP